MMPQWDGFDMFTEMQLARRAGGSCFTALGAPDCAQPWSGGEGGVVSQHWG